MLAPDCHFGSAGPRGLETPLKSNCEASVTRVWGRSPQWGPEAEPGQGQSPLKPKHF